MSQPTKVRKLLLLAASLLLATSLSGCDWFRMLAVPQEPSATKPAPNHPVGGDDLG